jgi:predicted Rossmann fold flavoprotein
MKFDVVVIGGGAAGLFCAAQAGLRDRRVLLIEHNAQVGRKILISGGGRCNFTNLEVSHENFVSQNSHFAKSALARYSSRDFTDLVRKHKIAWHEKKPGQLFCTGSSRQIVDMLLAECRRARVEIRTGCRVRSVEKNDLFAVDTNQDQFECESLVIATGGLSFPKIGATDFAYKTARQFGLKIVPSRPSLVALKFRNLKGLAQLAGVSHEAEVSVNRHLFRENILFTHSGLSGPAILQISNYWKRDQPVSIDLLPGVDAFELLKENRQSRQLPSNFLSRFMTARFAEHFAAAYIPKKPLDQFTNSELESAAALLNNWQVVFADTEGYDRAEVTLGGIDTRELSSKSMEAVKQKGLFFIGEAVDVTGWLGGYNFQWAWSSGFAAAQFV